MSALFDQGHALLIGAGGDLPETVADALGLAAIFEDESRCAFPPGQVQALVGTDADRDAILNSLDALAEQAGENATVVVYFSGHGYRVSHPALGSQYYLMPNGYDLADLSATAISGPELVEKLAAIPARKLLLLLDCCHAGGVGEAKAAGLEFAKAPLPAEVLPLLEAGRGRVLIASSREDELSYAGKPYSAFTLALIEALCGHGVSKQDGYVRVADLALHTRQVVPARTKDRQHPVLHFEEADNYVVAYYAGGERQPKGLPFSFDPQIEPEPGAWRGQVINTAGGPIIGGDFTGNYVRGDQTITIKSEDRSIHTHGPVHHSNLVSGDSNRINVDAGVSLEEFLELLERMQAALSQTGLAGDEMAEVQADLDRITEQASQPEPNKGILLKRLDSLVNFLANSATIAVAAPQLVEMGRQALAWAQRLFG